MAEEAPDVKERSGRAAGRFPVGRLAMALVAIVGLVVLGRQAGGQLPAFVSWVDSLGVWGPIVFILGYIAGALAFVPGSILTMAAGLLFGLVNGALLVFVSSTTASALAFLIARHVARGAVEKKLAGSDRFAAIDSAIASHGRKIVLLLRLSPVFPYSLLNYALGLTQIRFPDYVLASVGTIPGTILYVYYGKLVGDVAALAGGMAVPKDAGYYTILAAGLAATIVVTTIVTRIARGALTEATGGTGV